MVGSKSDQLGILPWPCTLTSCGQFNWRQWRCVVQWRLLRGGRFIIMVGMKLMEWHQTHRNRVLFFLLFLPPFFSPISWYPIVSNYDFVSLLQLPYGLGRDEGRKPCVLRNTTQPHCFLTQHASNPEASRTNASEEILCTWRPWLARTEPGLPQ